MTWLKEAITAVQSRKITDKEEREESCRVKRKEQEEKRLLEEEHIKKNKERVRKAKELQLLLYSLGIKELLDDVRKEVWHGGKIEEVIHPKDITEKE